MTVFVKLSNDGTAVHAVRPREAAPLRGQWVEVPLPTRPGDTSEGTYEPSVSVVNGSATGAWKLRPWTAEELAAREQADAERARYVTHEAILDATAALMEQAHTDGEPWTQPTGAHNAYPLGRTVTFGGKTWENLMPANTHEPGVSGWREVVVEGYPAWVQPAGAHDAYILGAKVAHNGRLWECTQVNAGVNSYEPGVWGWTDIGAAP